MKKLAIVMIFMAVMLTGCSKKETETIRIGSNRALGSITPYVAEEMGYFEESGIKVDVIEFADGTTLMEAMGAGELDMAICGITPAAVWQMKGVGLKVVASANAGGHVILSRQENQVTDVADLVGKKLAMPNVGTVTDTILRSYILKNNNISPDEMNIISGMKPADMATSLMVSGEVDAIMTWEPFASEALAQYDGVTIVYDTAIEMQHDTGSEHFYPVNVWIVSDKFISTNEEKLINTLKAIKKANEYINENQMEADKTIAKLLSIDQEVIAKARDRVEFTWEVDLDATYDTLNWAYELGYLENMPSEEELFDLSYQETLE